MLPIPIFVVMNRPMLISNVPPSAEQTFPRNHKLFPTQCNDTTIFFFVWIHKTPHHPLSFSLFLPKLQNTLCSSNRLANLFLSMPVAPLRTRIIKVKLPSESRVGLIVTHMPDDLCDRSTAAETGLDDGSFTEPFVTDRDEVFGPTHAD